jgi:hypothetical protein
MRRPSSVFFIVAAASAVLFLLILHPASGLFGGLLFLPLGSALPILMIVSSALGFACLLARPITLRIGIAFLILIPLSINTRLSAFWDLWRYKPALSSEIKRPVSWSPDMRRVINLVYRHDIEIFTTPFGPQASVGGDEGCMCLYFLPPEAALYRARVQQALLDAVKDVPGRHIGVVTNSVSLSDADVRVQLAASEQGGSLQFRVEYIDRGEKIAYFIHSEIPLSTVSRQTWADERLPLSQDFLMNALDILWHENAVNRYLNSVAPDYFPKEELLSFLVKAMGTP